MVRQNAKPSTERWKRASAASLPSAGSGFEPTTIGQAVGFGTLMK